jgi:acyl-CoA synthetase (AMP-forming)/AMP-acid ligase II
MSETFHRLALTDPHADALVTDDRIWSRADVDRAADRLAHVLVDAGVAAGGRIAWTMHNRPEVVLLALAAQRLGALVVSISYRSTEGELARLLAVAEPDMLIVEAATRDAAVAIAARPPLDVDEPSFASALSGAATTPVRPPAGAVDRMGAGASMLFTSGTTGLPKAAVRAKGDPRLNAAVAEAFGFDAGTRYVTSGPLYHSGPWSCALMALGLGGAVGFVQQFDAHRWLDFARRHQMTSTFITPTQLRHVVHAVEGGQPAPATLRRVVVSGERFPDELKRRAVAALGPVVLEAYGATELGPLTCLPAAELLSRPGSSGTPFPGVEVAVFDGDRRLPAGEVGLLRARTPLAFDGYIDPATGRPDGSGAKWTTVGDLGYVDADGWVHLTGRADDVVITGGVNVFPGDVEAVLREHPDIVDCAVFGLPDPDWGQVVCAAAVATRELDVDGVREWMRGRIADDKRPRRLFPVASLPTTGTGKVSRRELREGLVLG